MLISKIGTTFSFNRLFLFQRQSKPNCIQLPFSFLENKTLTISSTKTVWN